MLYRKVACKECNGVGGDISVDYGAYDYGNCDACHGTGHIYEPISCDTCVYSDITFGFRKCILHKIGGIEKIVSMACEDWTRGRNGTK